MNSLTLNNLDMKIIILHALLNSISLSSIAQTFDCVKAMGGTFDDEDWSVAIDALGNLYVTGLFKETVDFDPGPGTYKLTNAIICNICD